MSDTSTMDSSGLNDLTSDTLDLERYVSDWSGLTERVNWCSYRALLWKAMASFPATCEARTRILSPLLFRFLE